MNIVFKQLFFYPLKKENTYSRTTDHKHNIQTELTRQNPNEKQLSKYLAYLPVYTVFSDSKNVWLQAA